MGSEVFYPRRAALLVHGRTPLPKGLVALLSGAGFIVSPHEGFESLPRALAVFSPAVVVLAVCPEDEANWADIASRLRSTRVVVCGSASVAAARELVTLDIIEFFEGPCESTALAKAARRLAPM